MSLQEGTSKLHNFVRKGRETDVGVPSIPYKQMAGAFSDKGGASRNKKPLRLPFPNKKQKYASQAEDGNQFQDKRMVFVVSSFIFSVNYNYLYIHFYLRTISVI